jgi:hypothetical protein
LTIFIFSWRPVQRVLRLSLIDNMSFLSWACEAKSKQIWLRIISHVGLK